MGRGPTTTSNGQIISTKKDKNEPASLAAMVVEMATTSLKDALPRHLTPDRMARIVMTALRTTKNLSRCSQVTFFGSVLSAAQLGLECNTPLGHAWLIPREMSRKVDGKWIKVWECTLMIGYQGYVDLARRSGKVLDVYAHVVRKGDEFRYSYGLKRKLHHVPSEAEGREDQPITHVYAVAEMDNDRRNFRVLTKAQIDKRRDRSPAMKDGPWITDYEAMCEKTGVRALARWIPRSPELAQAAALDMAPELGQRQVSIMTEPITQALLTQGFDVGTGEIIDEEPDEAPSLSPYLDPPMPPNRTMAEPAPQPAASQPRPPTRRRSRREQAQEAAESQDGRIPGDPRTPEQIEEGWDWDQQANEIVPPMGYEG